MNKNKRRKKSIIIFGAVLGGVILLAVLFKLVGLGAFNSDDISGASDVREKHIGVLFVEGTIAEGESEYNHEYALSAIDGMMDNKKNKGLLLYVNTPGGGVYESDELYLKIKEYKECTGRPVYAYMGNQATSGGYYISAPADKILANRNCWTGSIGVTIGNIFDISGLLEKYGIKVTTITSGANKAMGDITAPMSEEQRAIFQSLVDDAYDQFVSIVADGRDLDEQYVRQIADGRIYTANQAKELNLIDEVVNTYDDALTSMQTAEDLDDCEVYEFRYYPEYGLMSYFIKSIDKLSDAIANDGEIGAIKGLVENNNELPLQYMCEVRK